LKRSLLVFVCCLMAGAALAEQKLVLLATMGSKALVTIDGSRRTLGVGDQVGGIKLVRIDSDGGVFEVDGKQRRLALGEGYVATAGASGGGGGSVFLAPDARGHYFSSITINGHNGRGVIDTGATHLSMNASQARAFDIDYKGGERVGLRTANGNVGAWMVHIPQMKLGEVVVYDVPVVVSDSMGDAPILIGTSVLSHFQMRQEQAALVLVKKEY
jgi:aspartyl protease family protein